MSLAGHARAQDAWQGACAPGAELGTTLCGAGRAGQQAAGKFIRATSALWVL